MVNSNRFVAVTAGGAVAVVAVFALFLSQVRTEIPTIYAAGDCTVSPQDEAFDAEEQTMLAMINQYRAQNGVSALTASAGPNKAAAWMSRDMATKNYFDHYDLTGRSPFDRMADCGYRSSTMGENIGAASGYGTNTASIIFDGWKKSPAHDAAMKNGSFKAAGIARTCINSDCYWTLDLGSQVDSAISGGTTPSLTQATATATPTTQLVTAPTPIPTTVGNLGATLAFLQSNVQPTIVPQAAVIPAATPIPTTAPATSAAITAGVIAAPTSTTTASAAVATVAPVRGWSDLPASSKAGGQTCPTSASWAIVYWNGAAEEIGQAAALCPTVDRFWGNRGGKWYGYSSKSPQSSDLWTIQAGEAVFARLPKSP